MLKNNIKTLIGTGLISIVLIFYSTLTVPTLIKNEQGLHSIKFGFPIIFAIQNSSYDYNAPCLYLFQSPLEHPTKFLAKNFWISFILIYLPILIIATIIKKNKKITTLGSFKKLFLNKKWQIIIITILLILNLFLININGGLGLIFSLIAQYVMIWILIFSLSLIKPKNG